MCVTDQVASRCHMFPTATETGDSVDLTDSAILVASTSNARCVSPQWSCIRTVASKLNDLKFDFFKAPTVVVL